MTFLTEIISIKNILTLSMIMIDEVQYHASTIVKLTAF